MPKTRNKPHLMRFLTQWACLPTDKQLGMGFAVGLGETPRLAWEQMIHPIVWPSAIVAPDGGITIGGLSYGAMPSFNDDDRRRLIGRRPGTIIWNPK